jgi:hypothetical protein
MIIPRIKRVIRPGTKIPKPQTRRAYVVIGWGMSRGEEALVYELPTRPGTKRSSRKRIPSSAFEETYRILVDTGEITRDWFVSHYPKLDADGSCNFTTLGGIFVLLEEAVYERPGVYKRSS